MLFLKKPKRSKTRRERYDSKLKTSEKLGLSFVTVNFMFEDNLAFLIRSSACFGVDNIYVIGSIPPRSQLKAKSGSLYDYLNIRAFSNPSEFLSFSRENNLNLISLEISDKSKSLYDYDFNFEKENVIVLGHETIGVPTEILMNSDQIHIPMPGVGFCLNVSQAGTVTMSEYFRRRVSMA